MGVFSTTMLEAQNYQIPSPERVDILIQRKKTCTNELNLAEDELKTMEEDPDSYSLSEYLEVKKLVDELKKCVASFNEELEKLRKDYPGWFNNPSAVANGKKKGDHITPRQVEIDYDALHRKILAVIARYGALDKPKH